MALTFVILNEIKNIHSIIDGKKLGLREDVEKQV